MPMTKSILLIVSGSIAAYKALDVVRRLGEHGVRVTCVLSRGGAQFVTPLSLAALSGNQVYSDLFSLKDESEMGHIRLSRECDVVAVVPASANIIASMVAGLADELATAVLLASNKPILIAPAMNTQMWKHPATQRNLKQLAKDGVEIIAPGEGMLACGEEGQGRLADVDVLVEAILAKLGITRKLKGLRVLVTSGATYEPLDPVRFIGNRSSGKQGHAIAAALADAGAQVTLVAGVTQEPAPKGVHVLKAETAEEMLKTCKQILPVDVTICAAAVSDWQPKVTAKQKLKKRANAEPPRIELTQTPDILQAIAAVGKHRPQLVVGFAAETESVIKNARQKLAKKGCDWIVANDVSGGKVFGRDVTTASLITHNSEETFTKVSKHVLAAALVDRIAEYFSTQEVPHGKRKHRTTSPRG